MNQQDYYVKYAKKYINNNVYEKILLSEISSDLNISKEHFNRLFKDVEGITPYTYVLNLKIEKAKQLLAKDYDICEVALEVGFFDQSHLNRVFKKHMLTTPKAYKKSFYTI